MTASGEGGRGNHGGGVGKRQQCFDVGLAPAGELNCQLVNDLLACLLNLRGDPPTGGMEPERADPDLFDDEPRPVAPIDVQQLVAEHCLLNLAWLRAQALGKYHQWPEQTEGEGLL